DRLLRLGLLLGVSRYRIGAERHAEDLEGELGVVARESLGLLTQQAALEPLVGLLQKHDELLVLVALLAHAPELFGRLNEHILDGRAALLATVDAHHEMT